MNCLLIHNTNSWEEVYAVSLVSDIAFPSSLQSYCATLNMQHVTIEKVKFTFCS